MISRTIFYDRLFPRKTGILFDNLKIDEECISYITNPHDSQKITNLITETMYDKFKKNAKDITILDGTACVGGDTITFCHHFGLVIPIEENEERFKLLINNLSVYEILNAYPILGNTMRAICDIEKDIHVAYLDPPWGGISYKEKNKLELVFDDKSLEDVILQLFELRKELKLVALKLPKNYDYLNFNKKLTDKYTVITHCFLKKMDVVLVHV